MEDKDEWIPYKELDLEDEKFNVFSIDTRDFHAGYRFEKKSHPDYGIIKKYPHFFHTKDEIVALLDRYFIESGGKGEWRYFDLDINVSAVNNWNVKYLRIWRTDKGFVVCNSNNVAIRKDILAYPVRQEHLGFH